MGIAGQFLSVSNWIVLESTHLDRRLLDSPLQIGKSRVCTLGLRGNWTRRLDSVVEVLTVSLKHCQSGDRFGHGVLTG